MTVMISQKILYLYNTIPYNYKNLQYTQIFHRHINFTVLYNHYKGKCYIQGVL